MKFFISQSMNGRDTLDILQERAAITRRLIDRFGKENVEVIDSFFVDEIDLMLPDEVPSANKGIYYLGKSIVKLAEADIFIDAGGPESRGCSIEREIANQYGLIIYQMASF